MHFVWIIAWKRNFVLFANWNVFHNDWDAQQKIASVDTVLWPSLSNKQSLSSPWLPFFISRQKKCVYSTQQNIIYKKSECEKFIKTQISSDFHKIEWHAWHSRTTIFHSFFVFFHFKYSSSICACIHTLSFCTKLQNPDAIQTNSKHAGKSMRYCHSNASKLREKCFAWCCCIYSKR